MAELFNDGVYYEPRSLWCARYIAAGNTRVSTRFPRRYFRNGSRNNYTLERIAICPINNPLSRISSDVATLPAGQDACGAIAFYDAQIRIGAPFRKSFSRYTLLTAGLTPRPTSGPEGPAGNESSLFGHTYLQFDKPLYLPKQSSLEWDLSSISGMRWPANGEVSPAFDLEFEAINVTQTFFEKGGLFSGSARVKQSQLLTTNQLADPNAIDDIFPFVRPLPWIAPPAGVGNAAWWNSTSRFSARDFNHQDATRSGSTCIYGMGTQIDQIAYDDAAIVDFTAAGYTAIVMSPLSLRVGSRIRAPGGVSGDWWWYPGAPLALVLDTVTPALVYDLPAPITLAPGEALEVEIDVPASATGQQLGLSFNGWASITG